MIIAHDGRAWVKRVHLDGDTYILSSYNEKYQPIHLHKKEVDKIHYVKHIEFA